MKKKETDKRKVIEIEQSKFIAMVLIDSVINGISSTVGESEAIYALLEKFINFNIIIAKTGTKEEIEKTWEVIKERLEPFGIYITMEYKCCKNKNKKKEVK
jgi:hypothetical protein